MDLTNKKICIAGLGGVGGYLGAALAKKYSNVYFYTRGERLLHIREHGLTIKSKTLGSYTVHPKGASDCAGDFGEMDLIFICTKNYSLSQICEELKPAVGETTLVLPVMNGTTAGDYIRSAFEKGIFLDGLIYINATAMADYSVEDISALPKVQVGDIRHENEGFAEEVAELLKGAGIYAAAEQDMEAAIWTKFIQNCAFNVATAYYLTNAQGITSSPERLLEYKALLEEGARTARALGIKIADDLEDKFYEQLFTRISPEGTSSLKIDMEAGRPNELETFSGALLKTGEQLGLSLPVSRRFYEGMRKGEVDKG